jgi:type I restriction enzyme S subunit
MELVAKNHALSLPKGYKQSEVGLIPSDWELTTFEMIADKSKKWSITGGPFGSNLKVSDYTIDGVQIVQLQNIGDGNFIDDYQIYTSEEKANELLSCNIYPNEIIISKMGDPVARACFIPNKAKRYLMASDGIRLVVNEKEFSKKFIHDYINSVYFRKRAFENSRGSTRLRIGLPELKGLLVIKPKLAEQTAIATNLSDADALINGLEKLITKKRNIKQGAMQKLMSSTGSDGKPKEGWEVKKLGEVVNIRKGQLITDSTRVNGNVPVIAGGKTPAYYHNKANRNGKTITISGSGASAGYVSFHNYLIFASDCSTIEESESYSIEFIFYLMQLIQEKIYKMQTGGAQPHIHPSDLNPILIPVPTKQEQTLIATILSDMDAEISALETKLEKYRKVKLGMMQNLLMGKIRLV